MNNYTDNLRKIKSLLIATSLQKKTDLKIFQKIRDLSIELDWKNLDAFSVEKEAWDYVVKKKKYDPKLVFCHPEIIKVLPSSSLYYRCLTGLSIKAAKDYIGSIESLEVGNKRARLDNKKALKMAQIYNTFICAILKGLDNWTIEDGKRTMIATMGITLDGVMRNKVGSVAEERIRTLIFEWLLDKGLIVEPKLDPSDEIELPTECELIDNIFMKFSAEPDVSFYRKHSGQEELLAIIEIKGGIDPAGALERYGAATKSFQHALGNSQKCKNFFLSAVYTSELQNRIKNDRLVEKYYNIVDILEEPEIKKDFFHELFHYSLRII